MKKCINVFEGQPDSLTLCFCFLLVVNGGWGGWRCGCEYVPPLRSIYKTKLDF